MNENRNKTIAKNTIFLYLRMLLVMFVSLFTVRIVLKNLGVEDYGIYNLVGGIVVLFSFITNSSSSAIQRYLNFAIGEDNDEHVNKIYSASIIIHIVIALIIFILSETIGLWFVNYYLVIPTERLVAANVLYQFSIVSTIFGILRIPYNAAVIAFEKMSFFALLSIFEVIMKLVIAIVLSFISFDKLIVYGILVAVSSFITFILNKLFVNIKFSVCNFKFHKDKLLYKELVSFSGWSLLSSFGGTFSTQGLNMLLNKFHGVIANAAMGISNQVNSVVYQLVSNFQVAFEPQIVKSYAANEKDYLQDLIFKTSKFSFYLLWFFVLPLSLNADFVLKVWLVDVPEYSVLFLRIILIYSLIDAFMGPLWMVSYAIGNIKKYQIVSITFSLLTLPITYFLLNFGLNPCIVVFMRVINNLSFSIWRLFYLKKIVNFPISLFLRKVILTSFIICLLSTGCSFIVYKLLNGYLQFFISCISTVVTNIIFMYFIGTTKQEKEYLFLLIKKIIKK